MLLIAIRFEAENWDFGIHNIRCEFFMLCSIDHWSMEVSRGKTGSKATLIEEWLKSFNVFRPLFVGYN